MCTFQNQSIKFNTTVLHVYISRVQVKNKRSFLIWYTLPVIEKTAIKQLSLYIFFHFYPLKVMHFFLVKHEEGIWSQE